VRKIRARVERELHRSLPRRERPREQRIVVGSLGEALISAGIVPANFAQRAAFDPARSAPNPPRERQQPRST
jgi:hypothetical protein